MKMKLQPTGVDLVKWLTRIAKAQCMAADLVQEGGRVVVSGRTVKVSDIACIRQVAAELDAAQARVQELLSLALYEIADEDERRTAEDPTGEAEALRTTIVSLRRQVSTLKRRRRRPT